MIMAKQFVARELITLGGFILFMLGFIGIVLSMVGLELTFLKWAASLSGLFAFTFKILCMFGGIAIMYISRTK